MIVRDFELPLDVAFEVPRQYADFCHGSIVHIGEGKSSSQVLRIAWDADFLMFENNSVTVRYKRGNVLGLIVNRTEEVMGQMVCTLRVLFSEPNGAKGTLAVLSTSYPNFVWLKTLLEELKKSEIPLNLQIVE